MRDKFNKYASYQRTRSKITKPDVAGTFTLARAHGAGVILTANYGAERFEVSDYSPGTRDVYGWKLRADGSRGPYHKLEPHGLRVEGS